MRCETVVSCVRQPNLKEHGTNDPSNKSHVKSCFPKGSKLLTVSVLLFTAALTSNQWNCLRE